MILDRLLDDPTVWRRVLLFAPHPDDESLAAGGLLHRAAGRSRAVRVVFATDGENNPWPQRFLERRWRIDAAARARWGAWRRAEARTALAVLGVAPSNVRFLQLPDQGLSRLLVEDAAGATAHIAAEIAGMRPTLLVAPAMTDRHPDHSALAVLLRLALQELPFTAGGCVQLAYVVHGRPVEPTPVRLLLTAEELACKRAAIRCHATQLALSRRRFLAHARIDEQFVEPTLASARHHVLEASADRAGVRLVVQPPTLLGVPVPALLDVVAVGGDASVVGRSIRLWPRIREVSVSLPVRPLAVHARLEPLRPFFDRDGWQSFFFPAERASLPIADVSARLA